MTTLTHEQARLFKKFVFDHIDDLSISDGDKLYLTRHLFMIVDRQTVNGEQVEAKVYAYEIPKEQEPEKKQKPCVTAVSSNDTVAEILPKNVPKETRIGIENIIGFCKVLFKNSRGRQIFSTDIRKAMEDAGYDTSGTDPLWGSVMLRLVKMDMIAPIGEAMSPNPKSRGRKVKVYEVL